LILSLTDKITLFLHNDEAGNKGTKLAHQKLIHQAFVRVIKYPSHLPEKTQPEHFTQAELHQILGSKKFNQEENNHA